MVDLSNFTAVCGQYFFPLWKWASSSDFPLLVNSKRAYETSPIFGCSQSSLRQINYQCQ